MELHGLFLVDDGLGRDVEVSCEFPEGRPKGGRHFLLGTSIGFLEYLGTQVVGTKKCGISDSGTLPPIPPLLHSSSFISNSIALC